MRHQGVPCHNFRTTTDNPNDDWYNDNSSKQNPNWKKDLRPCSKNKNMSILKRSSKIHRTFVTVFLFPDS